MKKKLIPILALSLVLSACGASNSNNSGAKSSGNGSEDTIKIGGIIPKTGAAAVYGNTAENGIKLAIEEINQSGGVNGKEIEYVSEDDKGDPTESVTVYNKLMEEDVKAIIGPITSKPAQAVADNSTDDNIAIITPTGTMDSITEGKDNVFRACFTDPLQGEILANFAADNLKVKKVAVLRNTSNDYSNGVADKFIEVAKEKSLEIVADEGYGENDIDFKVQLTNINKKSPDLILVPEYYEKDVSIAGQAKELGIKSKIIGPDGWDGVLATVAKGSEDTLEGIYFTNHYAVDDEAENIQNFVKKYEEKYNEKPSAFAALGYDTVYIYKEAFENAKSDSKEDLISAIKEVQYNGITGNLKFGENNNPIKSAAIIKIENGKYVFDSVIEPK